MRRAYLLAFSATLGTRDQVKALLDQVSEVITWRTDLPHSFYIVSEADAGTLVKRIREASGNKGRFIVTEIATNRQGWITPESWYLINQKRLKPKS